MLVFIIVLILVIATLLVLVVLAQDSKGGGLTGNMGGASQLMGTRRTTDWIEKATWTLAVALFVLALGSQVFIDRSGNSQGINSPNIERATDGGAVGGSVIPEDLEVPLPEEGEGSDDAILELTEPAEDGDATITEETEDGGN
ncbi:preprotein translocase subunit SecG [Flammeovirgaceae bacterium SG7u.111]|nr:preprotein translocase subunit SecG [Flammeovirgaceae bacterium SG7u.132]WPO33997.1 preprotein translocase subunit SecG [Flammeovirgaceae bacterium SG7u.111]